MKRRKTPYGAFSAPEMFSNARNFEIHGGNFVNAPQAAIQHDADSSVTPRHWKRLLLQRSAMSAVLDSNERIDPAKCHPDTRVVVTQEIMDWIEDSSPAPSMMRMYGPAGAGKSALAQTIGELCQQKGWLAASFFFSRTALGRNNGHTLIPTIAYQLTLSYPEIRHPIRRCIERDPSLLDRSIQSAMEEVIIGSFNSWVCVILCWITGSFLFSWAFGWVQPRLVMIDGLDECADPRIQCAILKAVAVMATRRMRPPLRILILSRPESHIMRTFDNEPIFRSINLISLDLGTYNANHDIELFLNQEFEQIKRAHPLGRSGHLPVSWPEPERVSDIARKSSGQFVYASVVMKYIQSTKHNPKRRMDIILGISPKPNLDTPFAELDALYTHIFMSVEDTPLVKRILAFITLPRKEGDGFGEHTTPSMIEKLLSLEPGAVILVLDDLRSVITSDGPDAPLRFLHASLSDFLLDQARSGELFVDIRLTHETLAREYLRLFQAHTPRLWTALIPSPPGQLDFFHFLAHYKFAVPSKLLAQGVSAFNFFSIYKSLHAQDDVETLSLPLIAHAWNSGLTQKFFHALEYTHFDLEVLMRNLYKNYPIPPSILGSLQGFLESVCLHYSCQYLSKRSGLLEARYVPILHHLLGYSTSAALGDRCAEGVYRCLLSLYSIFEEDKERPLGLEKMGVNRAVFMKLRFRQACLDCALILLSHASYSASLISLLLQQDNTLSGEPPIDARSTAAYLERFQDHADAPLELKLFLEKSRGMWPTAPTPLLLDDEYL